MVGIAAPTSNLTPDPDIATPSWESNTLPFFVTPYLSVIAPPNGDVGSAVSVYLFGLGLSGATFNTIPGITISNVQVLSGGTLISATFTISSDATPGSQNVTVVVGGYTSNAAVFTVNAVGAPSLANMSPNSVHLSAGSGPISQQVTIVGLNLINASAIPISPSSGLSVLSWSGSATEIVANVQIEPVSQAYSISVTTPAGTSNALTFTVTKG
jgi:hypothetical protein